MKTYGVPKTTQVGTWYEIPRQHERQMEHHHISWYQKFWNRPQSKILKRTPRDWGTILLAYLLFYLLLAVLSVIYGFIYKSTVSSSMPRVIMSEPGLTMEPMCGILKNLQAIEYNPKHTGEVKCYVDRIEQFLNKYSEKRIFQPCTLSNNYGFTDKSPCIFVKINKSFKFKLQLVKNLTDLPKTAPEQIKNYLKHSTVSTLEKNAWINCDAVNTQCIVDMQYFPSRRIPANVLNDKSGDVTNSNRYSEVDLQRVIAVQVSHLPTNQNVKIICKIWAKNLHSDNYINIKIKT